MASDASSHPNDEPRSSGLSRVLLVGLTLFLVGLVVAAGLIMSVLKPGMKRQAGLGTSTRHLSSMASMMSIHAAEHGWPEVGGKRFVLSLLATRPDAFRNPFNLGLFFSPADKTRDREDVDPEQWARVTMKALEEGLDVDVLTSYAGRRNDDPRFRIPAGEGPGVPILADLGFEGVVLIAFSDGSARQFDREALGLGPDDPIVVGDASRSEMLRGLAYD